MELGIYGVLALERAHARLTIQAQQDAQAANQKHAKATASGDHVQALAPAHLARRSALLVLDIKRAHHALG